jgi:hypothetical protein
MCLERYTAIWGEMKRKYYMPCRCYLSTSTPLAAQETGLSSAGLHVTQRSCIIFMYNSHNGYNRGTITSPPVLLTVSTQICIWTWLTVPCIVGWWGNIHKEWSKSSTTYMNGHWGILMVLDALHFNRDLVSACAGILDDYLTAPYVIANRLAGIEYADFLQRTLPLSLEEIPLNIEGATCFHLDGALLHFPC